MGVGNVYRVGVVKKKSKLHPKKKETLMIELRT